MPINNVSITKKTKHKTIENLCPGNIFKFTTGERLNLATDQFDKSEVCGVFIYKRRYIDIVTGLSNTG